MDESGDNNAKECPKSWDKHMKECFEWILMVSVSPIAFLIFMLMALYSLLRFLCKVALLFIIVAINTPFAVMYNVSNIVFKYNVARLRKSSRDYWNWSDPRANVGIEVKLFVSDFLKVVAGELLLLMSTGIITFFTAPLLVFYISTVVWVVAIVHKWLNSDCLSKTVLSCLCDCYGLSPMMFLFSFIGFFDIGCHPIAKCSFLASEAFLFVKDDSWNQLSTKDVFNHLNTIVVDPIVDEIKRIEPPDGARSAGYSQPALRELSAGYSQPALRELLLRRHLKKGPENRHQFNGAEIDPEQFIDFSKWNAFERGLFQLIPRIKFNKRDTGKYILKSFMVLKLCEVNLCEYLVERLELPEDYAKINKLYNFLAALSKANGFVTDKMRGRHEHSLTLLEIVEGVEENDGYNIVPPMDNLFVVA